MLQLKQLMHKTSLVILGSAAMALSSFAVADSALLDTAKAKSEQCVEPTPEMRKNHMKYMLHQRDLTMHNGIRTKQHSLKECINCHVEPDDKGNIADVDSQDHFCNGCHEYAAVTIDCFECHADRPQKFIDRGGNSASLNGDMGGELK